MKANEIKELLEMFKEYELTGLEMETENCYLNLKKEVNVTYTQEAAVTTVNNATHPEAKEEETTIVAGTSIKSPLVGTFYRASSPEAEPFVQIGDKVKKGDVLCIVEAMKVMNEISSTVDGTVKEILVENESGVSFDQSLFIVE